MNEVFRVFGRLIGAAADVVAPRTCLLCDRPLTMDEDSLCLSCILELPRTYFHRDANNSLAMSMIYHRRNIRAAGWLYYNRDSAVSELIHSIKYYDMPVLGRNLGRLYARELMADNFFNGVDALVPVPLHWFKHYMRHYNQSEMIASGISSVTGIPVVTALTAKSHSAQARLSGAQRRNNVSADTYRVKRPQLIEGKHIVIIDDVATTGTTLNAVVEAVLRDCPGVAAIDVLTLGVATYV